ncbi:outer-membrane protein OmpA domain containing protein [Cellulophaga phage phi4:1]|uniref:Outer-membrane protein OmpA domain containing protein n=3 Tax=Lightbulbvirus Cba41 TaxID=1918524 RepID=A0A0S2MWS4_9CAUD|nr:membrane protein [Cellulophaga phage phi4:1]AGO49580.1 outer-membrane protein OmpA domain containing protein [Cellulophaga phage phi4:1]ALO80176.1 outer-membrane protein OmpA domain containing protein [Cellulophaga phage phi4:1_13]ALO80373.1 outer-membrane protein OmpA domain containing protein [Cellulophaga phage phi4:1_18]
MKQFKIITAIMLLSVFTVSAQEYSKSSIQVTAGGTKIQDITSVELFNVDLAYRYMANTKFGAEVNVNYTSIPDYTTKYYTAGLHGVVNVGRVLGFESFSKDYTILAGLGGTYSDSNDPTNILVYHRKSNFHVSWFIDNEFRLNNTLFLKAGLDVITDVNHRPFTTGLNSETTNIINFNVGVVINLGKKEHADWHIPEVVTNTIVEKHFTTVEQPIDRTITNYYPEKDNTEYVYFANDSFNITQEGYDNIENIASTKAQMIYIDAYCSNVGTVDYNKTLAKARATAIKFYLLELGVSEDRIEITAHGIDNNRSYKIPELARRVVLRAE